MDVKEIVIAYLKVNGFDGLVNSDQPCGCGLDDLFPCGYDFHVLDCKPAYKTVCKREGCATANWCDCEDGDDCYSTVRAKE